MTLSVSIMHAPWREDRAAVVRQLLEVFPEAQIASAEGVWPTARVAWLQANGDRHLVLQDDIELCAGFRDVLAAALTTLPADAALSLCDVGVHGVGAYALSLPTPAIKTWLAWCETAPHPYHDDDMFLRYLRERGEPLYRIRPSIVKHLAFPTVVGNRPLYTVDYDPAPTATRWEACPP